MEKTIETRVIDTLKPHPRNAALYGNEVDSFDQKLVDCLKAGIWPGEIQVTTSNIIISGHRRCSHAIFADIKEAQVWVRHDLPEDPESPEVLEALLQGNLQRNKTREQLLREFGLWLEVEKEQAKGRSGQRTDLAEPGGENLHEVKTGKARDLAAKRVGLITVKGKGKGRDAEAALKALKAADAAEATGDAEQVEKAKKVKRELAKSLGGAVRVARQEGLLPKPASKPKPEPRPSQVRETQPSEQEPQPTLTPAPEPDFVLEPVIPTVKAKSISPENRKIHESQSKWITKRWVPAAQQLIEATKLLRAEGDRLGQAWRHRENGGQLFTIPYQRLAAEWQEKGYLVELAEVLGCETQSLDAVLLQLQHLGEVCASMADGMRMFTGCRPDNNQHG